jgi:hypothetical protein
VHCHSLAVVDHKIRCDKTAEQKKGHYNSHPFGHCMGCHETTGHKKWHCHSQSIAWSWDENASRRKAASLTCCTVCQSEYMAQKSSVTHTLSIVADEI